MRLIKIAAIFAALVIECLAASLAMAADQCSPFGDPPALVNQGIFARAVSRHNPICFGGTVLGPWKDADGNDRYACLYQTANASKENPLPLIVFLHGSVATADSVRVTGLVSQIDQADLGGKKTGFILIAIEGRYTTHYYPGPDSNALGWDNWYRQLSPSGDVTIAGTTYKENADAATIDHFIADEVASDEVDKKRIYMMGWSNGAAMAMLYALDRPSIAAAAVYSAPAPFGSMNDPCPQTPVAAAPTSNAQLQVFNPHVPIMHVRNNCDIGGICPNGNAFAAQIRAIGSSLDDVILDPDGKRVNTCDDSCGTDPMAKGHASASGSARGFAHHVRWPSESNPAMLEFLRTHPLATAAK
jgi:poly(3-hydroxybutyrate) depolymerase